MTTVADLLEEVATTGLVDVAALTAVTAKAVYADFMSSPPPPRIEAKSPTIDWPQAWPRVWYPGLLAIESDLLFRLLHNVLPVRTRIAQLDPNRCDGQCPHCPGQRETVDHLLITCKRTADLSLGLFFNTLPALPTVPSIAEFLCLAFTPGDHDGNVLATVATFVMMVWS